MTDNRKAPYSNNRMHHPFIQWGVILTLVGMGLSGVRAVNALENQVEANKNSITHEKELRKVEENHVNKKLDELREDSKEIKALINQLNQLIIKG